MHEIKAGPKPGPGPQQERISMKPIHIEATTLEDAWFQCVYAALEHGREFTIDSGSYQGDKRLEFDYITVHIKTPGIHPLLPQVPAQYNIPNPVDDDYINDYLPYLMTGNVKEGESYTYGQRICADNAGFILDDINRMKKDSENPHDIYVTKEEIWEDPEGKIISGTGPRRDKEIRGKFLNQMELAIWTYKNRGHRTNQMILQVGQPTDMLLKDPPCLRHIDTRIQDGKLHFYPYFRSWDLWGGFPANLAGIQMMKEYMAAEIGVEDGEIIAASKGLHLYNYVVELAEIVRGKTREEFGRE